MTILAVVAFLEMLLYMKKRCFLKALFISVLGAATGYMILASLGIDLPLTQTTAAIGAVLGLPGVLLMLLSKLLVPVL